MNRTSKTLFIISFFYLASSSVSIFAKNRPEWLNNLDNFCDKDSLCSTGSGSSLNVAKADARNNIQKIFETKVNSTFKNTLTSSNNLVQENTYEELNNETSGVLNGVNIIKTYEDKDGTIYVLAVLNKEQASKYLKDEIKEIDKQMKVLLKDDNYGSSTKVESLYNQRKKLNSKYLFLTGKEIPSGITYEEIIENKRNKRNNSPSYIIRVNDPYNSLKSIIKNVLVKNDLIVVESIEKNSKLVKADLSMTKQYLKVDGFEKYKIDLSIDIQKSGKSSGFIKLEFLETGRDKEQIYNKSIEKIQEYIEDSFDEFLN